MAQPPPNLAALTGGFQPKIPPVIPKTPPPAAATQAPPRPQQGTLKPATRAVLVTLAHNAQAEGANPATLKAIHTFARQHGATQQDATQIIAEGRARAQAEKTAAAGIPGRAGQIGSAIANTAESIVGVSPQDKASQQAYKALTAPQKQQFETRAYANAKAASAFDSPGMATLSLPKLIAAQLAEHAINSPGGFYAEATHPIRTSEAVGKMVEQQVEHPSGAQAANLLLLGLGGAAAARGLIARGAGAVGALRTGEGIGAAVARPSAEGGSLLHLPFPADRPVTINGGTAQLVPSHAPLMRDVQRLHDTTVARMAERNPTGRAAGYQARRAGAALTEEQRVKTNLAAVQSGLTVKAGKSLDAAERRAVTLTSNNTTPEERIAFHERQIQEGASAKDAKAHAREIKLLQQVKERGLVTRDENGNVVINKADHPDLHAADQQLMKTALARDKIIRETGEMSHPELQTRIDAPGHIVNGENARPGRNYVPEYSTEPRTPTGMARSGVAGVVGKTRNLIAKSHAYTGANLQMGKVPADPFGLVGRQYARAVRRGLTVEFRDQLKTFGSKTRVRPDDVLVYTGKIAKPVGPPPTELPAVSVSNKGALAQLDERISAMRADLRSHTNARFARDLQKLQDLRAEMAKSGEGLHAEARTTPQQFRMVEPKIPAEVRATIPGQPHTSTLSSDELPNEHPKMLEDLRRKLVPDFNDLTPEQRAAFQAGSQVPGHVWVPKGALGELGQPSVSAKAVAGSKPVAVVDAINNAQRGLLVYGKPGYVVPNTAGNTALLGTQSGVSGALNLRRSFSIKQTLGADRLARIKAGMGEGLSEALAGDERGLGTKAVHAMANQLSKVTDDRFRQAAFLYRARQVTGQRAFTTDWQKIAKLVDAEPGTADHAKLIMAFRQANRDLIDYGRLGPREREVVRRIFFLYPWTKGSTIYAGRFLTEHTAQAALVNELGQYGQDKARKDLGPVPSYLDGIFKVGGGINTPLTSNPSSAANFSTPAQVTKTLLALGSGSGQSAYQVSQFLSPAAQLAASEAFHLNQYGQPIKGQANAFDIAKQQIGTSAPAVTFAKTMIEGAPANQQNKIYPRTRESAALQFALGSAAPKVTNKIALNKAGERDQLLAMNPTQQATALVKIEQQHLVDAAKQAGLLPKTGLGPQMRKAFQVKTEARQALAKLGTGATNAQKFQALVNIAVSTGAVTKQQGADAVDEWKGTPDAQMARAVAKAERYLYGKTIAEAAKYVRDHGGTIQPVPSTR